MDNESIQLGLDERADIQQASADTRGVNQESAAVTGKARWYTRFAALATLLTATSCGPGDTDAYAEENGGGSDQAESAEIQERQPELQLEMNNDNKYFGIALFFGQGKTYSFRVTSKSDPLDIVEVHSSGKKADLMEGNFRNPTTGYSVEAFDEEGFPVPIVLKLDVPDSIYGPSKFE